jgi:ADP-L-glycero-D-manno-heptose 6-epimerase
MIVITGGAGFIGSNLVARLEARGGAGLVIVDHLGSGDKWRNLGKREVLAIVPPADLFSYLGQHRSAIQSVFHLGASSSTTETDIDYVVQTNFTLSQQIWRWCADNRTRLIYASSAATYGDGAEGFDDDPSGPGLARLKPLNAYGWSKHLFDRWAARQAERGYPCPPSWAGVKFFNVYGPNEYHKGGQLSVALQLYRQIEDGGPASLFRSCHPDFPDGGQKRDFVWIDDVVELLVWLEDQPKLAGIFNIGSGKARSFAELAQAVYAALGRPPQLRYIEMPESLRGNYQYFTEARLERLRQAGYTRPMTGLEDGIKRYVQDFLMRSDMYR